MRKERILLAAFATMLLLLNSCKKDDIAHGGAKETILYATDFDKDDYKWWTGNETTGSVYYSNGYYVMKRISASKEVYIPGRIFTDNARIRAIETSVKLDYINDQKSGYGGLVCFHQQSGSNYSFYSFQIAYDGYFAVAKYQTGKEWTKYVDWEMSNSIRQNQFNTLRISLLNGKLHFYINGDEVYTMSSPENDTIDYVGLIANGKSILQADYFKAIQSN